MGIFSLLTKKRNIQIWKIRIRIDFFSLELWVSLIPMCPLWTVSLCDCGSDGLSLARERMVEEKLMIMACLTYLSLGALWTLSLISLYLKPFKFRLHFKFLTQITKSKAIQQKNSNLNHIQSPDLKKKKKKDKNFTDYEYMAKKT